MTLRQLRDSLTSLPFNTLLGMRLHRVQRDGITIDCTLRNDLRNDAGVAPGGIAQPWPTSCGRCHPAPLRWGRRITTVALTINYFLAVTEGRIRACSHPLRIGSTLCVGDVDLADEHGRAIRTAVVTYRFVNPPAVRTSDLGPQASARVPGARRVTRPSRRK